MAETAIEPLDYATYLADILEASQEAGREEGFFTSPEFARARDVSIDSARIKLRAMYEKEYIAPHRGRKLTLWGKLTTVDGWLVTAAGRELLLKAQKKEGDSVPA